MSKPNQKSSLYRTIMQALQSSQFVEAEKWCVHYLAKSKLNAQVWTFLGEALFRQGYITSAKRVFMRAWLLDPRAAWTKIVFAELAQHHDDEPREDIERLLEVVQVTVCAAIMVKNEERCIARCIESIRDAVDEIIVLDTGSTDRTLSILQQYTEVRVFHHEWKDDFAEARNAVLPYISTDWVLWLDADEYLHPDDASAIKEAAGLFHHVTEPAAYIVGHINAPGHPADISYAVSRLFQMRHGIRYYGAVHEQLGGPLGLDDKPIAGKALRIRLYHDGYSPEIMQQKNKLERNIKLLKRMVANEPEQAAWWYFLGRDTFVTGNLQEALHILLHAERIGIDSGVTARLPEIHALLIQIYNALQHFNDAEQTCHRAIASSPSFPDHYYRLGQLQLRRAQQLLSRAHQHLNQAKTGFSTYRGLVPADQRIHSHLADEMLNSIATRLTWQNSQTTTQ